MSYWILMPALLVMGFVSTALGYSAGSRYASKELALCIATVREDIEIMAEAREALAKMRTVVEACAHRPLMDADGLTPTAQIQWHTRTTVSSPQDGWLLVLNAAMTYGYGICIDTDEGRAYEMDCVTPLPDAACAVRAVRLAKEMGLDPQVAP